MLLIIPTGVDYRARRYPVVTFTLMGICTAVYLVTLICALSGDSKNVHEWVFEHLWLVPADLHWWTFLTHQFVHAGVLHLIGNMIYLFLFGSCVEDIIGRLRFTLFYLGCGIAAALTYMMVSGEHSSNIPMGGASGAISGCIGGFMLLMLRTHVRFKWIFFFWFRVWNGDYSFPAWLVVSFWFLKDFAFMILTMMLDERQGGVAFAAHVGGTLAGMGLISLEKFRMKRLGIDRIPLPDDDGLIAAPVSAVRTAISVARPSLQTEPRRVFRVGGHSEPAPELSAGVAPLVAAPVEVAAIHLSWEGAQYGPFTPAQVRTMFLNREIPAGAFYWQEGMDEWRTAEELREPGVS